MKPHTRKCGRANCTFTYFVTSARPLIPQKVRHRGTWPKSVSGKEETVYIRTVRLRERSSRMSELLRDTVD